MAFANKIIFNKKTGQLIKFIRTTNDTDGQLLEMNVTFAPKSFVPPMHYHPRQTENFRVISGSLMVNLAGKIIVLQKGEMLEIPARVKHAMWNDSKDKTIVNWRIEPALQTEYLLETLTGLANDNQTNARGVPSLLQKVLTARKYHQSLRLAHPPYLVQKLIFALITPIAILSGRRADNEKYFT